MSKHANAGLVPAQVPAFNGTTDKANRFSPFFFPKDCLDVRPGTSIKRIVEGVACCVSMIETLGQSIANSIVETENLGNCVAFLASFAGGMLNAIEETRGLPDPSSSDEEEEQP